MLLNVLPIFVYAASLANAVVVERALEKEYDYVIVGGGTSGCVVANRLSEDSDVSVLVIEAGPILDGKDEFDSLLVPPTFDRLTPGQIPYTWPNITTVPMENLYGRNITIYTGKVAGGGSAVNGKIFARGSRRDFEDWASYLDDDGWGWESMLHYYKKAETFTPPTEEYRRQGNVTWDDSYRGHDGPISVTYPAQFLPSTAYRIKAYKALGFPMVEEEGSGENTGSIWFPISTRPEDYTRSYSKRENYDPVKERPNLHFLADNAVTKILFDGTKIAGVEYAKDADAPIQTVRAKKEVIVAAGSIKTPQLLQISGVGPKHVSDALGVDSVSDVPVGENYQDHATYTASFNFTFTFDEQMWFAKTNQTWMDEQYDLFINNSTGYYTATADNNMLLLSMPLLHGTKKARALLSSYKCKNPKQYLHAGAAEATVESYARQYRLLMASLATNHQAVDEKAGFGGRPVLVKPLSRGVILANSTNIWDAPLVDHRTLAHPLDLENIIGSIRVTRTIMAAPELAPLEPVENTPGPDVETDEELAEFIRNTMSPGGAHGCCGAPMGTVLDEKLRVRGVKGLRVVDTSAWPIIPGTHATQSTAYAVAERAADLIRGIE